MHCCILVTDLLNYIVLSLEGSKIEKLVCAVKGWSLLSLIIIHSLQMMPIDWCDELLLLLLDELIVFLWLGYVTCVGCCLLPLPLPFPLPLLAIVCKTWKWAHETQDIAINLFI